MIPRPEHPFPQAVRKNWINLNGEWEFEYDCGVSGIARRLYEKPHLPLKITVPFCPESILSGIGNTDFLNCVWYRRDIVIPEDAMSGRVLLHFGAVDRIAHVYINGKKAGAHVGGYSSFCFDITELVSSGINSLCVCAVDNICDSSLGHGKQSEGYYSEGCSYTRVTGIWQTVWLEFVPRTYIKSFRLTPDIYNSSLGITATLVDSGILTAEAFYNGNSVGKLTLNAPIGGVVSGTLTLSQLHLWEVGNGRLYDLKLTYGDDSVDSYFGMRSAALDGYKFMLNGKSVFQRLVLDQGYYPDGIYTAPSDEALINDIQISLDAGFNGARLHEKVFEPRFLYHADRMGYLVWGEYANWGLDHSETACIPPFQKEWSEIVERDYNHPSIIGWCPLNETWPYRGRRQNDGVLSSVYYLTKILDTTRPCIDTSGHYHVVTDIYDLHDYEQDPKKLELTYNCKTPEEMLDKYNKDHESSARYQGPYTHGTPIFISEYGGIKWDSSDDGSQSWGYGNTPTSEKEFLKRYKGLTDVLLDTPYINGFCYTQLYDVEQERNGLYTYSRIPKFDMEFFKKVNSRKAKIEE